MPQRVPLDCILLLSLCLSAACTDGPESESTEPTVPEWRLEIEGRIGSLDDPEELLDDVDQVLIGPDEQLFVPQDHAILVFDPAGNRVGTIGREGEGPGEFTSLRYVGLVGDTLYAAQSGRLSYFTLDGRFLLSRALVGEPTFDGPVVYFQNDPVEMVPLPDGGALMRPQWGVSYRGNDAGPHTVYRVPFFRVNAESEILDTVFRQDYSSPWAEIPLAGETFRVSGPFDDYPLAELLPDGSGVAVVDRRTVASPNLSAFRVTLLGSEHDTVFSTSVPFDPVPVSPELLARALDEQMALRPGPPASEREAALGDADLIPTTLPPVTGLAGGQDGTIWLKREDTLADSVLWQILDQGGQLHGQLHLPETQSVAAARGDLMIAVELDALEVPYIVRYRILR